MKAVLVLAHGSRERETKAAFGRVVERVRERFPGVMIEAAFLQFCEPDVGQALKSLVEQGANDITAIPYFLFEGVHIREDIPRAIAEFAGEHPGVRVRVGGILGADERLADILADRVGEAL